MSSETNKAERASCIEACARPRARGTSQNGRMTPKRKPLFDPKLFLAKVGKGRTISEYRNNQVVFLQGDRGDAIFLHPQRQGQAEKPESVIAKISQEVLAEMIGTSSRISFFMNKFGKTGFIDYNGELSRSQLAAEYRPPRLTATVDACVTTLSIVEGSRRSAICTMQHSNKQPTAGSWNMVRKNSSCCSRP